MVSEKNEHGGWPQPRHFMYGMVPSGKGFCSKLLELANCFLMLSIGYSIIDLSKIDRIVRELDQFFFDYMPEDPANDTLDDFLEPAVFEGILAMIALILCNRTGGYCEAEILSSGLCKICIVCKKGKIDISDAYFLFYHHRSRFSLRCYIDHKSS